MSKRVTSQVKNAVIEELIPLRLTKSERTRLQIIESAIRTYGSLGVDYVSYEDIAREAKISRPLIQHYFPKKSELLAYSMKMITAQFSEMVQNSISNEKDPKERLKKYLTGMYDWVRDYPYMGRTWIYFLYMCTHEKELKKVQIDTTKRAIQLYKTMLAECGVTKNLEHKARALRHVMFGSLIELLAETESDQVESLKQHTLKACMAYAEN